MIAQAVSSEEIASQLKDGFNTESYNVKAKFALVVYTNDAKSRLTMTRHSIKNDRLGLGEVINTDEVLELINSEAINIDEANGRNSINEGIIDPCILVRNYNSIIWHRPRQKQSFYLYKNKVTLDLPPLVFKYTLNVGLSVFAIRHNKRPTANETLYHAPFMNVYADGKLCLGSMTLPKSIDSDTITEIEKEFYNTTFTHTNHEGILRSKKNFTKFTNKKASSGDKILISELATTGRKMKDLLK